VTASPNTFLLKVENEWKLTHGMSKFTYGNLLMALANSVSEAERLGEDFKRTRIFAMVLVTLWEITIFLRQI